MMRSVFLLMLLGACALPGSVSQLDRMTKAQTQGRDAENAAETPDPGCAASADAACSRIQAIRGRACLALARAEAAPGAACPPPTPTAIRHLDCAVDSFSKAGGAAPAGSADAVNLAENSARADYCVAGFRPPAEGVALLRQAHSSLSGLPPANDRALLSASVALAMAQRTALSNEERCTSAREAAQLAGRGLDAAPPGTVADALRATRNAARQAAAGLTNCMGT